MHLTAYELYILCVAYFSAADKHTVASFKRNHPQGWHMEVDRFADRIKVFFVEKMGLHEHAFDGNFYLLLARHVADRFAYGKTFDREAEKRLPDADEMKWYRTR